MRYKVLSQKAQIDPEVCLLQAASALDAAAECAEKVNDVEGLLNAAAMWMRYSEQISEFAGKMQEAEKPEGEILKSTESKIETGFQWTPEIVVEEEDDRGRQD